MENGFGKALQHVQGYVSNLGDPTLQFFIKKGFGASFPQELFFISLRSYLLNSDMC